jgi:histone H3/H4
MMKMSGSSSNKEVVDVEQLEVDRLLPIANVARIMKCALPEYGKLSKEARETMQECVSEFILFITTEASDRCLQEKRKTINGEDLLWAFQALGFDNYVEPMRLYLNRYREHHRIDKELLGNAAAAMAEAGGASVMGAMGTTNEQQPQQPMALPQFMPLPPLEPLVQQQQQQQQQPPPPPSPNRQRSPQRKQ